MEVGKELGEPLPGDRAFFTVHYDSLVLWLCQGFVPWSQQLFLGREALENKRD